MLLAILLGQPTGPANYTITAQGGSYTLTGGQATLKRSKLLTASGGAYSLAGQQVTITKGAALNHYTLTANGGAYSLAGQSATVLRSKRIQASGGSYSLAGQSATVLRSKRIQASGGSYTLAGQSATITYTPTAANYQLTAQGGSYNYSGGSATIERDRKLTASGGSYTLAGQSATLKVNSYLTAQGGVYSLSGQQATITYSGEGAAPQKAHGFEMGGKPTLTYIKRGKKILVFETNEDAARYLEDEKAKERAARGLKPSGKAPKRVRKVTPPTEVDLPVLESIAQSVGVEFNLPQLIDLGHLAKVIQMRDYLIQRQRELEEEEEIELLLLAA